MVAERSGPSLPFAELLRDFRLLAGLTQEELAERAGLSPRGVSDLERAARRNPYPATVRQLAAALHLAPDDQASLEAAAQGRRGPARRETATEGVSSSLTSFVGREREQADVQALLARNRLITLTGIGGIGKTRLALAVADHAVPTLAEQALLVELAALSDPQLVPRALASQLGVRPDPSVPLIDSLVAAMADAQLLLVLDNCEHVLSGCAAVVRGLLDGCPRVRILATSREPLGLRGEMRWLVPRLPIHEAPLPSTTSSPSPSPSPSPSSTSAWIGRLGRSDAARLFVDRARAVWPTFALTEQTAPAVARICRRLEGIPLAIELAAARTRVFSVEQLDARLDDRFRLLVMGPAHAHPRHQTLRAALDWSYALLSADEQRLLERLSVFRGGALLEAIEAVCGTSDIQTSTSTVADVLQLLVEKSLLVAEPAADGIVRFRQLETVREYAHLQLADRGEADDTRTRHLGYYADFAERADAHLRTPEEHVWFERLEHEHDNLRAALGWAQQQCPGGLEAGLRLAAALGHFWIVRGHANEGRRSLEELLANSGSIAPSIRATGLYLAGRLAFENGDYQHSTQRFEEALALWRSLSDGPNAVKTLNALGTLMAAQARFDQARAAFEEVLAVSQATDNHVSLAGALVNLGMTARHQKRYDEAGEFLEEAVEMFRRLFESSGENRALHALGNLAADRGDDVAAAGWFRQALALSMDLRDWSSVARCLESLGLLIMTAGDALRAAQLYAAAEALRQEIGVPVTVAVRPSHDQRVAALENLLGRERFLAAWRHGRSLSPTRAVRLALDGR